LGAAVSGFADGGLAARPRELDRFGRKIRCCSVSRGMGCQSGLPRGHAANITGGALAPNHDRHQDATCFVLNSDAA
jgi:hypothetical protein